ncbi:hypothetical protein NH340_JMT02578 [Sarcoptes scabiei]|nr:hypothetical protein NH340_JMT02578 [Sarcoptes scabiei]
MRMFQIVVILYLSNHRRPLKISSRIEIANDAGPSTSIISSEPINSYRLTTLKSSNSVETKPLDNRSFVTMKSHPNQRKSFSSLRHHNRHFLSTSLCNQKRFLRTIEDRIESAKKLVRKLRKICPFYEVKIEGEDAGRVYCRICDRYLGAVSSTLKNHINTQEHRQAFEDNPQSFPNPNRSNQFISVDTNFSEVEKPIPTTVYQWQDDSVALQQQQQQQQQQIFFDTINDPITRKSNSFCENAESAKSTISQQQFFETDVSITSKSIATSTSATRATTSTIMNNSHSVSLFNF